MQNTATEDAGADQGESATPASPYTQLPVPLPTDSSTVYAVTDFPALSLFDERTKYPALLIPVKLTAKLRNTLKHVILRRPKMKNVYAAPDGNAAQRLLVLDNNTTTATDDDDDDDNAFQDPVVVELLKSGDCSRTTYAATRTYDDFTVDQILRKLLPATLTEIPSAWETIGRLAHMNLREHVLPFKYWIGKVVLDKNQPTIQTVVNKLSSIDTVYRTFGMQVIAGSDEPGWSHVTVKEEGCAFDLDFTAVYWNSRLAGEHRRLVQLIQEQAAASGKRETVVADLMAGVGPFAVPLTRPLDTNNKSNDQQQPQPHITVYANDLNPASYKYLTINSTKNKCRNLNCFNVDGRALVHQLQNDRIGIDHVIMNLPKTAPDFLDAFRGYTGIEMPRIHVHCFAPKLSEAQDYQDAVDRCATALGCPLLRETDRVQVHVVRDVSPNKNMLCVSFTLPDQARSLQRLSLELLPVTPLVDADEPNAKRPKVDTTSD